MDIKGDLQDLIEATKKGISFLEQYRELLSKLPIPNEPTWSASLRTFEGIQKILELAAGGWSLHLEALQNKDRTLH